MVYLILIAILLVALAFIISASYRYYSIEKKTSLSDEKIRAILKETIAESKGWLYAALCGLIVIVLVLLYLCAEGTPWEAHLLEWLNIVIRVLHVTFGIAWIGASFYFVFLENSLNRTDGLRDEIAGNLWAVHGGGFYYLEKYKVAPKEIPKELHWFKYEAYFTWLSGFSLLSVVYYFNAKAMLIDPSVLDISPLAGVGIGIGSFVLGWLVYHGLCKTPIVKNNLSFAILGFLISVAFAWFYTEVFSSRAAYIHFGAMLATIMAGNVFFIIIPAQKEMVKCARLGLPLNPELGRHAGLRSLHNNYFTMPVLFVMVSNHFPSTFGNKYSWIVLAAITLAVAGIKHWLNLREKGQLNVWIFPLSAGILLAVAFATGPVRVQKDCRPVSNEQAYQIIKQRCQSCHSSGPTDDIFKVAPNGVVFDDMKKVEALKDKILQRAIITKTMPLNNKTKMTEQERETLRCWIEGLESD